MKRKSATARKPALPLCGRHRLAYEVQGGRPVCRYCESEARAAAAATAEREAPA